MSRDIIDASMRDERRYYKRLRKELAKIAKRVGPDNVAYRFLVEQSHFAGSLRIDSYKHNAAQVQQFPVIEESI